MLMAPPFSSTASLWVQRRREHGAPVHQHPLGNRQVVPKIVLKSMDHCPHPPGWAASGVLPGEQRNRWRTAVP